MKIKEFKLKQKKDGNYIAKLSINNSSISIEYSKHKLPSLSAIESELKKRLLSEYKKEETITLEEMLSVIEANEKAERNNLK